MEPAIIVPIGGMVMVLGMVIGLPLVRAYAKKVEQRPIQNALGSGEVVSRLDRIEQAVEAMSTEIERISEGQRFTTKLLSESRSPNSNTPPQPAAQPASSPLPETKMSPDGTMLSPAARRT